MRIAIQVPTERFDVLHRALDKPEYANDFADGRIGITTAEQCRAAEDKERADEDELSMTYHGGTVTGDSRDPVFREIARRQSVAIGPGTLGPAQWTLSNNTCYATFNVFLLCTSPNRATVCPKFGPHLFRIDQPQEFLNVLTLALQAEGRIREYGIVGRVQYGSREYRGLERLPAPSFVKPMRYKSDEEVRMLWLMADSRHAPFLLNCPAARRFVTRLSYFPAQK